MPPPVFCFLIPGYQANRKLLCMAEEEANIPFRHSGKPIGSLRVWVCDQLYDYRAVCVCELLHIVSGVWDENCWPRTDHWGVWRWHRLNTLFLPTMQLMHLRGGQRSVKFLGRKFCLLSDKTAVFLALFKRLKQSLGVPHPPPQTTL